MTVKGFLRASMSGVAFAALIHAGAAFAQIESVHQEPAQSEAGDASLDEITVTAQRRSESAQTVPISVAAFSADSLAASGTRSTADLPSLVVGLAIHPTGGRTPIYLRGVGNNNASTSPAVITFVDGVYQPFNFGSQSFSDIAGIEVAKGPQGTLFGRNATGGVIQVTTRDPSVDPEAEFEVGYGNYDTISGKAYVSGGLADNLRASVAAFYENQRDGWGTNIANGRDILTTKSYGIRNKFVFDVSDATTIKIAADYAYGRGNNGAVLALPAGGQDFLFDYVNGMAYTLPGKYDVNANYTPGYVTKEGGVSLTVDSKIGELNFLSITGWRKNKTYLQVDYDGTPVPFFDLSRLDRATAITQEFQLKSQDNSRFNWVAGVFYYHNDTDVAPFRFGGIGATAVFGAPPGSPYDIFAFDTINAYAVYGQATAELLADTRLTLGARYTIEKHDQNGYVQAGGVIPGTAGRQSATFKKPNFRVALDHQFSRNFMVYTSYNRGFNAGYFNTASVFGFTPQANPVVLPETIDAYEVGFKSELFDRRVRFNVAAFQYDYSNLQQQIFRNGALVTVNAASARIRGVDLEVQTRPVAGLDLALSAEYLDPEYRAYPAAPLYSIAPNGALILSSGNAKGYATPNAPKFSFNASANYSMQTSFGAFDTGVSVNYRGKDYADSFERFAIKTRYLLNANIRWTSIDEKTTLSVWGKNLLDQHYDEAFNMLDPVGPAAQPGAPLTYGVTLGRKF